MFKSNTLSFFASTCTMLAALSLTGCAVNKATSSLSPGSDLTSFKSAYVVKLPQDGRHIDKIIKANLEKRGYVVTNGPALAGPYNADVAVTYADKWVWDITMYMVELSVNLRDPKTGFPLATGNSYHTSMARKSPEEMVDEVLGNIFTASP
jgi:hypothetical protein